MPSTTSGEASPELTAFDLLAEKLQIIANKEGNANLQQRIKKLAIYAREIIDSLLHGRRAKDIIYNAFEMQMLICVAQAEKLKYRKRAQALSKLDGIIDQIDNLMRKDERDQNSSAFSHSPIYSQPSI